MLENNEIVFNTLTRRKIDPDRAVAAGASWGGYAIKYGQSWPHGFISSLTFWTVGSKAIQTMDSNLKYVVEDRVGLCL